MSIPPRAAVIAAMPGRQAVDVHVEAELRVGVPAVGRGLDLAHVAAPGQGEQAGSVFQCGRDVVRSQVLVLLQPQDQPRVDAAGSGRHDQPFQRGEAHGRVDAATVEDGGE